MPISQALCLRSSTGVRTSIPSDASAPHRPATRAANRVGGFQAVSGRVLRVRPDGDVLGSDVIVVRSHEPGHCREHGVNRVAGETGGSGAKRGEGRSRSQRRHGATGRSTGAMSSWLALGKPCRLA